MILNANKYLRNNKIKSVEVMGGKDTLKGFAERISCTYSRSAHFLILRLFWKGESASIFYKKEVLFKVS